TAQAQVERGAVEAAPGVPPQAVGAVVDVRVVVPVRAGHDVEGQRRAVLKDVTKLETGEGLAPQRAVAPVWRRLKRAAQREPVALVIVGQAPLILQIEIVL